MAFLSEPPFPSLSGGLNMGSYAPEGHSNVRYVNGDNIHKNHLGKDRKPRTQYCLLLLPLGFLSVTTLCHRGLGTTLSAPMGRQLAQLQMPMFSAWT